MEKYMMIDGNRVEFTNEKTMLAVILKAGIILPTFCYYSDLSTYGACRMCVVEDEKGHIPDVLLDAAEGSRRNFIRIRRSFTSIAR